MAAGSCRSRRDRGEVLSMIDSNAVRSLPDNGCWNGSGAASHGWL
jgi:hypothetical protein